ncbi:MAG: hypothetical protein DWQ37_02690 [Planctomycetota bacterium]|nr:MAG: hypothetical protein DWQ37_02690 [Planctomycetota bacterium]
MEGVRANARIRVEPTASQVDLLQMWLDRLNAGDDSARERLIELATDRLRILAHNMLAGDRVRRWEETDDVMQEALVQLHRSLSSLRPPTARDFLRIASFQIRRAILGMARHYFGPRGMGTHQAGPQLSLENDARPSALQETTPSQVASRHEQWLRLQHQVDQLPDELREVTELMWFHALPAVEVARVVGVSERTVRRRWQRARLRLADALHARRPVAARQGNGHDVG